MCKTPPNPILCSSSYRCLRLCLADGWCLVLAAGTARVIVTAQRALAPRAVRGTEVRLAGVWVGPLGSVCVGRKAELAGEGY